MKYQRKGKPRGRPDITAEIFIDAFVGGGSYREVAQKLNISPTAVHLRAYKYRRMGIKLPKIPAEGTKKGLDIDALNAMVERLRAERLSIGAMQQEEKTKENTIE